MTGINDFLPWAVGGGALVVDQATYAALPEVSTGYAAGIADELKLNKTWRQATVGVAALMTFVSAQNNINARDDGDLAALTLAVEKALQFFSGAAQYADDVGAVNNLVTVLAPNPGGYYKDQLIFVKIAVTNTGPAVINDNGHGNIAIKKFGSAALVGGELQAGAIVALMNDGVNFQLLTQAGSASFQAVTSSQTVNTPAGAKAYLAIGLGAGGGGGQGTGNVGSAGGNTTINGMTCNGGGGGTFAGGFNNATASATVTGATLGVNGARGSPGLSTTGVQLGGAGASSWLGGGGVQITDNQNPVSTNRTGYDATGYGAGGGGSVGNGAGGNVGCGGSAGALGFLFVSGALAASYPVVIGAAGAGGTGGTGGPGGTGTQGVCLIIWFF